MKILWERGEIAPDEQFLLLSTMFCYPDMDQIFSSRSAVIRDNRSRDSESWLYLNWNNEALTHRRWNLWNWSVTLIPYHHGTDRLTLIYVFSMVPDRIAQSVGHLTSKSEVVSSIPGLATYFVSPSADSRRAVVSYWRKYVHEVLLNSLGGRSLPRKSVVRLTPSRHDLSCLSWTQNNNTTSTTNSACCIHCWLRKMTGRIMILRYVSLRFNLMLLGRHYPKGPC